MCLKPFCVSTEVLDCCGWDCEAKSTQGWQNILLSWWLWMAFWFGGVFFLSANHLEKNISFFVQVLLIGKSINFLHQVCHDQTPSTKMIAVAKSAESSKDGRVFNIWTELSTVCSLDCKLTFWIVGWKGVQKSQLTWNKGILMDTLHSNGSLAFYKRCMKMHMCNFLNLIGLLDGC